MILKKSIIVFIPYNFRGKQINVFLSTLLSFFLNLYFTNRLIHSVMLLLSWRKLRLIILQTKLLIPHPSPEALFKASSSFLTKGSEFPWSLCYFLYIPKKQGRHSVLNCPQTQTKISKQNLLSSLAKGSENGWLNNRKLLAILTPIQWNRKTASLLHPTPPLLWLHWGTLAADFQILCPLPNPGSRRWIVSISRELVFHLSDTRCRWQAAHWFHPKIVLVGSQAELSPLDSVKQGKEGLVTTLLHPHMYTHHQIEEPSRTESRAGLVGSLSLSLPYPLCPPDLAENLDRKKWYNISGMKEMKDAPQIQYPVKCIRNEQEVQIQMKRNRICC